MGVDLDPRVLVGREIDVLADGRLDRLGLEAHSSPEADAGERGRTPPEVQTLDVGDAGRRPAVAMNVEYWTLLPSPCAFTRRASVSLIAATTPWRSWPDLMMIRVRSPTATLFARLMFGKMPIGLSSSIALAIASCTPTTPGWLSQGNPG